MNTEENTKIEQKAPLSLESLPPLPERNVAREWEKGQYWSSLLTGDLATVPEEVRRKAGAADDALPASEQDYRLAASINRSWVVDHRNMSREEVRTAWPDLRHKLSEELEVADNESEVYAGLSLRHTEEPLRQQVRRQRPIQIRPWAAFAYIFQSLRPVWCAPLPREAWSAPGRG